MDNRLFRVNGSGTAMLLKTLELAFMQSHGFKCKGWTANRKGLILTWYVDDRVNKLPSKEGLSAAQVLPMVDDWLKEVDIKDIDLEQWEDNLDHDGHNSIGWCVYCEEWGHVKDMSSAICAIKPVYLWHGK